MYWINNLLQSDSLIRANDLSLNIPALFTTMSIRPKFSSAVCTNLSPSTTES